MISIWQRLNWGTYMHVKEQIVSCKLSVYSVCTNVCVSVKLLVCVFAFLVKWLQNDLRPILKVGVATSTAINSNNIHSEPE